MDFNIKEDRSRSQATEMMFFGSILAVNKKNRLRNDDVNKQPDTYYLIVRLERTGEMAGSFITDG